MQYVLFSQIRNIITSLILPDIAHAIPNPSDVDVPLPSSSIIISDLEVAVLSMQEASSISLMKVLIPLSYISLAPTRVIIASITGISADLQGTKQPICARRTQIAV